MAQIQARLLKGFRDFLPAELWQRQFVIKTISKIFEKYGYEPIETPALEYFDILMGKYGEQEKLVYNFEDFGGRRIALKYDLTVPASRVMAQYQNQITLPWKRYQIQPVWRADNTQRGRFREFYQCDADIFGAKDMTADAEYIQMGIEILNTLGFKDFVVRLNNRKILNGISKYLDAENQFLGLVYVIDDWDKRDLEENKIELQKRGISDDGINKLIGLMDLNIKELAEKLKDIPEAKEGIDEVLTILNLVDDEKLIFDLTIARGLSYYTGPVWEWKIIEGNIGSVGGCGRYDKLVGTFTGMDIPATGGSFGLERILEVMKERDMLPKIENKIKVMVTIFNAELAKESFQIATELRNKGLETLMYPSIKPLKKQFEYASKKNIPYVITIGEDEKSLGVYNIKDMKAQKQSVVVKDQLFEILQNI